MLACKTCFSITEAERCPNCGGELSKDWQGYVVVLDAEKSEIAKRLNIKKPGSYALKVR
jgi:DNA-directed RNA polymerase subunit E"